MEISSFFRLFHAVQDIFEKKVTFIDDYRLQPEVLHLQAGGEPLGCGGYDRFVFADGVIVSITDEKLQGVSRGTTYVQKYVADTNGIIGYKVEVE